MDGQAKVIKALFCGVKLIDRTDVEELLLTTSPLIHPARFDNFYLIRIGGEKVGVKGILYSLTDRMGHHAYDAVETLIELGFIVRAAKKQPIHIKRFMHQILAGLLRYDDDEEALVSDPLLPESSLEGRPIETLGLRFERSPSIRRQAIQFHGLKCMICDFSFQFTYGDLGLGYIEVHHLEPLSHVQAEHDVNPKTDLVVLCSNCHRIVHRIKGRTMPPVQLKSVVEEICRSNNPK